MKRKSLNFKLREIAKVGTLRTYSREEAIEYVRSESVFDYDKEQTAQKIEHTKQAYNTGLIFCVFRAYPDKANSLFTEHISQFTKSLPDFVINIVWALNF